MNDDDDENSTRKRQLNFDIFNFPFNIFHIHSVFFSAFNFPKRKMNTIFELNENHLIFYRHGRHRDGEKKERISGPIN